MRVCNKQKKALGIQLDLRVKNQGITAGILAAALSQRLT